MIIKYILIFWLGSSAGGGPATAEFSSPWACEQAIEEIGMAAEKNNLKFVGICVQKTTRRP